MRINGQWVGWGLGDNSATDFKVRDFKRWAKPRFFYARDLDDTNLFDMELQTVVIEMQRRLIAQNKLPANLYPNGILDGPTQLAVGFTAAPATSTPGHLHRRRSHVEHVRRPRRGDRPHFGVSGCVSVAAHRLRLECVAVQQRQRHPRVDQPDQPADRPLPWAQVRVDRISRRAPSSAAEPTWNTSCRTVAPCHRCSHS